MKSLYCPSCKKATPGRDHRLVTSQKENGKTQQACSSTCSICGKKKHTFVPNTIKTGDGLFDFLGSTVGGFLNDVGNKIVSVGERVAIPVLQGVLQKRLGGGVAGRPPPYIGGVHGRPPLLGTMPR